jgi:archaellum component FlaC
MDTRQPEKLETLFWGPSRDVVQLQESVKKLTTEIEGLKTKYESFHSDLQRERQIFQEFVAGYIIFRRNVEQKLAQFSDIIGSSASGDEERYDSMPDIIERLEDLEESMKRLRRKKGYF